jgi:geranylgeranyl diphosphate synthase, type II
LKSNDINTKYKKTYLAEVKKIEIELKKLLKDKEPISLYEPCSYVINAGGKRLRPFLVLISVKASGGKFSQAYNGALAVELLHNFTLVHDDIMDNSDKRRGRPTLHNAYNVDTAILAGDGLVALAYETLIKDCKQNVNKIFSTFTEGIKQVCEGQSLDKEFELKKFVSIDEYKVMIYKKTAALLETCCAVGSLIACGSVKEVKAASSYGRNLGMAFQIQDDLLDIFADESQFGKATGTDLLEGKKTYLFLRALEKARGNDKKLLLNIIKNKGTERTMIPIYKEMFLRLGVIKDAEQEIIKYTKLALKNISTLPDEEGRELMNWLANYLIHRNK